MNRKGFTLVEAIVALALAALLAVTAIAVVAPIFNVSRRVSDEARAQMVAENALNTVRQTLVRAATVSVNADGTRLQADGADIALNAEGHLEISGRPAFAAAYYGDGRLTLQVRQEGDAFHLYLAVVRDGETLAEAESAALPMRVLLGP